MGIAHRIEVGQYVAQRIDICQYDAVDPCCTPLSGETLSPEAAAQLAQTLKALADPVRLQLISIIAASSQYEVCACDLPALVDRSQGTVSHHLKMLTEAGLLQRQQRGKWAWFRLRPERFGAISAALWDARFDAMSHQLHHLETNESTPTQ